MLTRLIGEGTTSAQLKEGLNASSRTVRGIAHRVANASTPDAAGTPEFARTLEEALEAGEGEPVDIEREMFALADEQLRFETAANLLQKVYQQIRSSVRER